MKKYLFLKQHYIRQLSTLLLCCFISSIMMSCDTSINDDIEEIIEESKNSIVFTGNVSVPTTSLTEPSSLSNSPTPIPDYSPVSDATCVVIDTLTNTAIPGFSIGYTSSSGDFYITYKENPNSYDPVILDLATIRCSKTIKEQDNAYQLNLSLLETDINTSIQKHLEITPLTTAISTLTKTTYFEHTGNLLENIENNSNLSTSESITPAERQTSETSLKTLIKDIKNVITNFPSSSLNFPRSIIFIPTSTPNPTKEQQKILNNNQTYTLLDHLKDNPIPSDTPNYFTLERLKPSIEYSAKQLLKSAQLKENTELPNPPETTSIIINLRVPFLVKVV